jgi:hypothetical protein
MGPKESQMNLEGLDKFIKMYNDADTPTALGNTLSICSLRHQGWGGYAAFIYSQDNTQNYANTFPSMVEDDDFWQGHLTNIPWFPLRFGNTPQEALDKLVKFLTLETPQEHRELCMWNSMCASLAFTLVQCHEENRSDLDLTRYKETTFTRKS